MNFKQISEKYPKGFGEFVEIQFWGVTDSNFELKNIRQYYSDIVDFFDGKGIMFSSMEFTYSPKFHIVVEDETTVFGNIQSDSRSESETAGLEQLFKIYEERIGK